MILFKISVVFKLKRYIDTIVESSYIFSATSSRCLESKITCFFLFNIGLLWTCIFLH